MDRPDRIEPNRNLVRAAVPRPLQVSQGDHRNLSRLGNRVFWRRRQMGADVGAKKLASTLRLTRAPSRFDLAYPVLNNACSFVRLIRSGAHK